MDGPLRVLIVEDEPMLALQLEDEILEAGHAVVGCAMTSREALDLAHDTHPDLIFMDVQLADGPTGIEAGRSLARDKYLVVFLTGSAHELPDDMAGTAGVIDKPYTSVGLRAALFFVHRALGTGVLPPPPASLRLSPERVPAESGMFCFA